MKQKLNWKAILFEGNNLSMGRLMAWAMFVLLMVLWSTGSTVDATMIGVFLTLMGYNMGKKLENPAKEYMKAKFGKSDETKT